jgi:chromate transporter
MMITILKSLLSLAALWHIFAFAAGGVYVFHAYRVLFYGGYNPVGTRIIRTADWQLWLSGFTIIGLGILINGYNEYTSNPKLWAKLIVIVIWLISTQSIRRYAAPQMRAGNRIPMLIASSLNVTCWIYGAFLGVAHSLGFGTISFKTLISGFDVTLAISLCITALLENKKQTIEQKAERTKDNNTQ